MSIITQEKHEGTVPRFTGAAVESGLSPVVDVEFDALRSYKQEFFDLYGELLTVAHDTGCKYLITDRATARVMEVRTAADLTGSDESADWLSLSSVMLSIQREAEESDDCCEIYHRAAYLASRASVITQKMRR